jgi:hypothetical protein
VRNWAHTLARERGAGERTKVSDPQIPSLNITAANFHGEWNYTIAPRNPDL